jgi:hypothetical protein
MDSDLETILVQFSTVSERVQELDQQFREREKADNDEMLDLFNIANVDILAAIKTISNMQEKVKEMDIDPLLFFVYLWCIRIVDREGEREKHEMRRESIERDATHSPTNQPTLPCVCAACRFFVNDNVPNCPNSGLPRGDAAWYH